MLPNPNILVLDLYFHHDLQQIPMSDRNDMHNIMQTALNCANAMAST